MKSIDGLPARARGRGTTLRRLNLPVQLETPGRPVMKILSFLWACGLVLAVFSQAGASWREYVHHSQANPAFHAVGLTLQRQGWEDWRVSPGSAAATAAGVESRSEIERVGSLTIPRSMSLYEVGALLPTVDGQSVSLRLRTGDSSRDVTLVRSSRSRAEADAVNQTVFKIISQFVDVTVALLMIVGAVLLRIKRFREPLAIIFSFTLLFFAMVGTWRLWVWVGLPGIPRTIDALWLGLALFGLAAFPSGRFVPSGSRWFLLAGPAAALIMVIPELPSSVVQVVRAVLIAAVLACIVSRFRRTPAGLERQQIKWVMLAFGIGTVVYGLGEGVIFAESHGYLPLPLQNPAEIGGYALSRIAYLVMALGIVVSLLDYRLNDADAAIGRSAAYATLTTVIGLVWALSTYWINKSIIWVTGDGNSSLATAISTLVALLVLTPARTRVMAWTEGYFQRALVQLKALPRRIARWQHADDPDQVAASAVQSVVDGVKAVRAALVTGDDQDGWTILAASGTNGEEVMAQLGGRRPADRRADLFPLRVPVEDHFGRVATLLLGRRSDNASYSREEQAAIKAITEPLADALRASKRNAELAGAIAELRTRLQELEGASGSTGAPAQAGAVQELRLAK